MLRLLPARFLHFVGKIILHYVFAQKMLHRVPPDCSKAGLPCGEDSVCVPVIPPFSFAPHEYLKKSHILDPQEVCIMYCLS